MGLIEMFKILTNETDFTRHKMWFDEEGHLILVEGTINPSLVETSSKEATHKVKV